MSTPVRRDRTKIREVPDDRRSIDRQHRLRAIPAPSEGRQGPRRRHTRSPGVPRQAEAAFLIPRDSQQDLLSDNDAAPPSATACCVGGASQPREPYLNPALAEPHPPVAADVSPQSPASGRIFTNAATASPAAL